MAQHGSALGAIIGNDALRQRLGADLRARTLSHAYLIEGAPGVGKRTLARELSAALACTDTDGGQLPCRRCAACRKVLEGNSPDVIRVRRTEKASIGVDEVRFLRSDVLIPPNELDYKIYIIEEADTLTAQAQNALLLTLEEPPSYVIFLLLCRRADALLATIRSRAPVLRLSPLPTPAVREYLSRTEPDFSALPQREQEQLLMVADGSIGRALELLDPRARTPLLARRGLSARVVEHCLSPGDGEAAVTLTRAMEGERSEMLLVLSDALLALRDLTLLKRAEGAPLCFYADREEALGLCDRASLGRLLEAYAKVEGACRQLGRNANVRLVLATLLF